MLSWNTQPAAKRNREYPLNILLNCNIQTKTGHEVEVLKDLSCMTMTTHYTGYNNFKSYNEQVHCLVLTITGDICWIVRKFIVYVCTIMESKVGSSMKHVQVHWCWELKNTLQNITEGWKLKIYIVFFSVLLNRTSC